MPEGREGTVTWSPVRPGVADPAPHEWDRADAGRERACLGVCGSPHAGARATAEPTLARAPVHLVAPHKGGPSVRLCSASQLQPLLGHVLQEERWDLAIVSSDPPRRSSGPVEADILQLPPQPQPAPHPAQPCCPFPLSSAVPDTGPLHSRSCAWEVLAWHTLWPLDSCWSLHCRGFRAMMSK